MFFWHAGATVAFTRYTFRDPNMDLRFLILGAILPDLIDTPLGIGFWPSAENVRLAGHSLVFAAIVMALVLLTTRRGRPRKQWMPLAIGLLLHLVFDAMWRQPETLWWPFQGWAFASTGYATYFDYLGWLFTDPVTWLAEAAGLAYLLYLGWRSNLVGADERQVFLRTGRVQARIGR
jgi:inner membrane protein